MTEHHPEPPYDAIGRAVVSFAAVESLLQQIAWTLYGQGWLAGFKEFGGKPTEALCSCLVDLAENPVFIPLDELKDDFLLLVERASGMNRRRHEIVHGMWPVDATSGELGFARFREVYQKMSSFELPIVFRPPNDVQSFVDECRALRQDPWSFASAIWIKEGDIYLQVQQARKRATFTGEPAN